MCGRSCSSMQLHSCALLVLKTAVQARRCAKTSCFLCSCSACRACFSCCLAATNMHGAIKARYAALHRTAPWRWFQRPHGSAVYVSVAREHVELSDICATFPCCRQTMIALQLRKRLQAAAAVAPAGTPAALACKAAAQRYKEAMHLALAAQAALQATNSASPAAAAWNSCSRSSRHSVGT